MPKDLNRPWEDPMPDAGERLFTMELRGISVSGWAKCLSVPSVCDFGGSVAELQLLEPVQALSRKDHPLCVVPVTMFLEFVCLEPASLSNRGQNREWIGR